MQCPNCQAGMPDHAQFCGVCGREITRAPACPTCGKEIRPGQKFCIKCGTALLTATPPAVAGTASVPRRPAPLPVPRRAAPAPMPSAARPRRRLWLMGIPILAVAALAIGGWLLVKPRLPDNLPFISRRAAVTDAAPGGSGPGTPAARANPGTSTELTPSATRQTAASTLDQDWSDAQARAAAGDWAAAVDLLATIRQRDPAYAADAVRSLRLNGCTQLARAAEQNADVAGAQGWWACVLEEDAGDAAALRGSAQARLYLQGASDFAAQRYPGAIAAWQDIYAETPSYADVAGRLYDALLAYGDALCTQQDTASIERARQQYDVARPMDPARREAADRLLTCLLPTPTPLPGPHLATVGDVTALRVRSGPGLGYLILGKLDAGSVLTITSRTEDSAWVQVRVDDTRSGWVSSEFVDPLYPVGAAPVAVPPPLPRSMPVAQAARDFSEEQGRHNWYYLISDSPGNLKFTPIPWDSTSGLWYRWCCTAGYDPRMRISDNGLNPGLNHDVARMYANPYEGTLHITGRAYKAESGGNGVYLRIVHKETILWDVTLSGNDRTGVAFDVPVDVQPGEYIYFIAGARGNVDQDNTVFEPSIDLLHADGIDQAPVTPWPDETAATPTPVAAAAPPRAPQAVVCYEPRLRQYEEHKGCCAEVAGVVFNRSSQASGPRGGVIRIEGPPGNDRYVREFGVDPGGGYAITALSVNPYTVWLKGPGISSKRYAVTFPDLARIRIIVDFYQVACS